MFKITITVFLLFSIICVSAQEPIPKDFKAQKINDDLKATWDTDMFNNIDHPLAIAGGILTFSGSIIYLVASIKRDSDSNNDFHPNTNLHYIGIGIFFTGAVLFAVFSTERDKNVPKRKKGKKKYNAADWEAIPE